MRPPKPATNRRRLSRLVAVLAVATAVLLVLEGVALSVSFTAPTSLTIGRSPRGAVAPGTEVLIRGRLRSPRPVCRKRQRIQLVKIGTGVVDSTRTNRRGKYRFEKRVFRTSRFRTRFRGSIRGVHPNIKTCLSSRSKKIKVRVAR